MRFVCYIYDIPKSVAPKDYPNPGSVLRRFAVHAQQSCWIMPETMLHRTADLSEEIRALGGKVHELRYDEQEHDKIVTLARSCLETEAERIRRYVEASIETTTKRLEEAKRLVSVDETNAAIRFQQTALHRATRELTDAEECAVVFDLTGSLSDLLRGVRAAVSARTAAFTLEKVVARSSVQPADPASLGFGLPDDDGKDNGNSSTGTEG